MQFHVRDAHSADGDLRAMLGPFADFFCGGEVGPIGGKNFIHGFTAGIALFCEP